MKDYQEKVNILIAYNKAKATYERERDKVAVFGGEVVRFQRGLVGMSLRQFAKVIEVSPSFLSKVERGKEILPPDVAGRILCLHGIAKSSPGKETP